MSERRKSVRIGVEDLTNIEEGLEMLIKVNKSVIEMPDDELPTEKIRSIGISNRSFKNYSRQKVIQSQSTLRKVQCLLVTL